MSWRFAWGMARREWRASRRRLAFYAACMALGIAALVSLDGLRATVRDAVDAQSRALLGGDLRLESRAAFAPELEALVDALVADPSRDVARITRFGSMALVARTGRTRLVDVQGVEGGFPFHGAVVTEPADQWRRLLAGEPVALVDASLLVQLDARVGDELALGDARFVIAGSVRRAPGTFGMRTRVAPRVFVAGRHVGATGLVQRGSLVDHLIYARAGPSALAPWLELHRPDLTGARVRVQTVAGYEEDLSRSFGTLTRYLGLVGLAALALGGVGVAAGVRVFVREKLDSVAMLRALGASSWDVLVAYGMVALALGAAGGVAGSALGVALQWALPTLLADFLPVQVTPSVEPWAVASAIALALWLTLLFAGLPILELGRVPPLRALRRDFAADPGAGRDRWILPGALAATLAMAALWQAPSPGVGLAFAAGLAAVLALLAGAARAVAAGVQRRRLRAAPFWLRQGVANLFRPRNHTVATVVALGFGLFVVATLQIVRVNLMRQLEIDSRSDRPNLVLFDVQSDQRADVEGFVRARGAAIVEQAPLVSMRIARVAGREVSERLREEDLDRSLRWALRREYRATWSAELRASESITDGRWWTREDLAAREPVPVSFEDEMAELLGVGVGDGVTWDIQGVRTESVVRSLREVDWDRLATNFVAVFAPGLIEEAPQSFVLLLHLASASARAELQRDLVTRFANVSAIDATLVLRAVDAMLHEVSRAVRVLALFTLATGLAILVAAAAAARHERLRESLLLRTLGAPASTVRRIVATEALALGLIAACVGTLLSLAAAWGLVRWVFEIPFAPPWGEIAALAGGLVAVTALVGTVGGRPTGGRSALSALREAGAA